MSKNVVLTLESRFMDEYGEYANLPVFNGHGSIVGYVGGEVPESGNPCEFNRLNDEGFTFCASATEVVRLKADNDKLREELDDQAGYDQMLRDILCQQTELCIKAEAENAKLRELAEKAWKAAERLCQAFDGPCRDDGVTIYKPCPMGERDEECVYGLLQRDLRDLGVEAD